MSLLHVGDVVVRCGDAARTRDSVTNPLIEDMRVTQIHSPCHLLPRSCAWSSGALRRLFLGGANIGSESSSSQEVRLPCSILALFGRLGRCVPALSAATIRLLPELLFADTPWLLGSQSRRGRRGWRRRLPQPKCPLALREVVPAGVRLWLHPESCPEFAAWLQ